MSRDYIFEIKEILKSNISDSLKKEKLMNYHENDIADCLEDLEKEERLKLYKILGNEFTSDIFSYFEDVDEYVEELPKEQAADIIELMDSDDAKDVLDELEEEDRQEIIDLMESESQTDLNLIDKYSEDEIGSLMTNNYIEIKVSDSVKTAMKKLISQSKDNDNISLIYVTDEKNKYYGCIELRDLIIARDIDSLTKIIKTSYPFIYANELISDTLPKLMEYSLVSYPILASDNTLIGSITQDDITEAVDVEIGDDYAKLGGLTEEEDIDESIFMSFKKRIPWLITLLILGLIQSLFLSGFEDIISTIPALVFFQTSILGMSGNCGTQALAVTIRLISSDNFTKKDGLMCVLKELRIGFINGLILGILGFGTVLAFLAISNGIGDDFVFVTVKTAFVVGVSLLASMTLASLVGALMPLFFMKIKIDPAVASGPFITTINDICALIIYYGLSTLLFIVL